MAIYLASRILIRPGDAVIVDDLTYPPAREAFRAAGAIVLRAKVDEAGTNMDSLEKLCRKNRVRVVYLTPHHHFPTTVLLNPDRRLRLLALSSQFGLPSSRTTMTTNSISPTSRCCLSRPSILPFFT